MNTLLDKVPMTEALADQPCKLEHIKVEIAANCNVLEDGSPDLNIIDDAYDLKGEKPYWCTNCDEDLESWEDVQKHISEHKHD